MTQNHSPYKLFEQILKPANRHNPYPLYAQLRENPISRQEDGTYVVSTYREIEALLYYPRISSDERKSTRAGWRTGRETSIARAWEHSGSSSPSLPVPRPTPSYRLRRVVMHHFSLFGLSRDYKYFLITSFVLIILTVSLVAH
jgi:hypothetical protein